MNGKIYSEIAKQKNVSVESIEHAIRLAINSCWKKANEKKQAEILCTVLLYQQKADKFRIDYFYFRLHIQ